MGYNPNSTGAKSALSGSTSGTFTQFASATTATYSAIWPNAQGTGALINDGAGNLSWEGSTGVTSVALALPGSIFSISGSPVTGAGTLTGSLIAQPQNTVWAGPTSGSANPTFRLLVAADIPNLSSIYLPLTGGTLTGSITATNFSGSSSGTNTGDVTLAAVGSSPNANAATLSGQVLNLQPFDGTHPGVVIASGGGTTNFLRADGTWVAPTGTGTVTSVGLVDSTGIFTVTGSPVTGSGSLTLSGLQSQFQNSFLASPDGISGSPTFRPIVMGDLPSSLGTVTSVALVVPAFLSVSGSPVTSSGTLTVTLSGTALPIANGGTAATGAAAAYNNLSPMSTAGDIEYEISTNTAARLPIGSTGQVLTVVAGAPAWAPAATNLTVTEDVLTLSSGDISAQFKDLNHAAQGSSASLNSISLDVVGGPEQQKTVDYTVSLTGGVAGVTRITFAGNLATAGTAALVAGDILMVKYAY